MIFRTLSVFVFAHRASSRLLFCAHRARSAKLYTIRTHLNKHNSSSNKSSQLALETNRCLDPSQERVQICISRCNNDGIDDRHTFHVCLKMTFVWFCVYEVYFVLGSLHRAFIRMLPGRVRGSRESSDIQCVYVLLCGKVPTEIKGATNSVNTGNSLVLVGQRLVYRHQYVETRARCEFRLPSVFSNNSMAVFHFVMQFDSAQTHTRKQAFEQTQ